MKLPKVSIVTISLNAARYIETTIKGVLRQQYPDIEYIIIDGNSTDGTQEIIERYSQQLDYFISEPDDGISSAFNKGICRAKGELIGIINSGDWYEPDAVKNVVLNYLKAPRHDVYYGQTAYMNEGSVTALLPASAAHFLLPKNMYTPHPSVFVTRKAYVRYGLFDTGYKISMDYEWLLRATVNGASFKFINARLANYQGGGISETLYNKGLEECGRARTEFGIADVLQDNQL
ncbi:MAG TPA: glycosyltransferase family 2 protein [Chitinophaga sp.]|uniref:glycosyltransferase family 2 protein n=1 Tax=Chitinophaga sp. TaxID=1869181 RepID=UPI002BCCDB52|nr:glycosyltransferase family 2 protein [Chitinophaga sp.]HVI49411.1 glycosyltransferase family 2 protein [Chitinophaga sp.]